MFKIGDIIKLIDYEPYGDYRTHKGQVAKIIEHVSGELNFRIRWADGATSRVSEYNIEPREWNEVENVVL